MAVGAVVCSPGTVSSWGRHMGVAGCVITCSVFVNLIRRLEKLEMSDGQYGAGLALSAVMRMVGHSPEDPAPRVLSGSPVADRSPVCVQEGKTAVFYVTCLS